MEMKFTQKTFCGFIACLIVFVCLLIYGGQLGVLQTTGNETRHVRQTFDLRIIVLTYDRPTSLQRLLDSLQRVSYHNDSVMLEVWVDRNKSHFVHEDTHKVATDFKFDKGVYEVHVHPQHVGLTGQWLSTWSPKNTSKEIALILEDDLTVSSHCYTYLKMVHKKYGHRSDVAGFSLHGESVCHGKADCVLNVPFEHIVFWYPTLGTWGFSPNNKNWFSFLQWYSVVKANHTKIPFIAAHTSTGWYTSLAKGGKADTMWEMEYLYYTRINKEWTLYPNFKGHRGLTLNWFEKGLHFAGNSKTKEADETNKLLLEWNIQIQDLPDEPVFVNDVGAIVKSYPDTKFIPNTV